MPVLLFSPIICDEQFLLQFRAFIDFFFSPHFLITPLMLQRVWHRKEKAISSACPLDLPLNNSSGDDALHVRIREE